MSTAPASTSSEERLKQLLQIVDAFCTEATGAELQTLANEAKSVVNKMQNKLERCTVEHVAKLVQATEWDKATMALKHHFPLDGNIGRVEEVLVCVGDNLDSLTSAIKWVGQLDAQLKPRAYEVLYEKFKFKKFTDHEPQVLMLRKRVGELPEGMLTNVRVELDQDFQRIIGLIVKGLQKNDRTIIDKVKKMGHLTEVGPIMNEVVTAVVQKCETGSLKNTLLLIQYSLILPTIANRCCLMEALFKALEVRKLLKSEQALHLYAHAKFLMEVNPSMKETFKKFCTNVLDQLTKYTLQYFNQYKKYVEQEDKDQIKKLHTKNWCLCSIGPEFVSWYFKQDDLTTVQKLLSAAKAIGTFKTKVCILTQLQIEMEKCQQSNTFETLCLFNEVKFSMSLNSYKFQKPQLKAAFEELKAKAPACLRLLLWPERDEIQLKLVNKFFDEPVSIQKNLVVCCNSQNADEGSTMTIDPETALTTFSFKSGNTCWKLDAAALEGAKEPWIGSQWKLKAVDEIHVKIFTDDGKNSVNILLCKCSLS